MNRWADCLDRVDRAIDRVMAERLRIEPMAGGDFGGISPDPARSAFEVDAVLSIERGETDLGGNAQKLRNVQIRGARAEAQIQRRLLPPGAELRKDDRLLALDRGLAFKIERIDSEHPGRIALELSIDRSGATA
ncbi:MAG TPA: hypothetical protein PK264_24390 [Hyphomicrobiaceae bacterium]|nr:hypothetical protein [Hyphomicrobiaceae bacterium]